ncbi:sigma-70 family RNA polymerase sigma factor [Aquitalea aquatica]|uniref:Sigma-70 family RNA polymerase sigma factor n=1 Tax=Aquitalea aquatica TaxID=3044273 RepID=A0A838XZN2_9NEIS|nr:sigma-70 family RNA polymerase sigma factor [Aquitalea magnusonii]MBA4707108.1 sigma-70 family RNA polymerase sigma factor [Aquitalea magnusonii]
MPVIEPIQAVGTVWEPGPEETDGSSQRETLIESHLPLVRILAAQIFAKRIGDSFEFHDLFQWGVIGLLEAVERYRSDSGVMFKTYAEYRIRGEILDNLASTSEVASQMSARKKILRERAQNLEVDDDASDPFEMLKSLSIGFAIGFMLEDSGLFQAEVEPEGQDLAYQSLELKQLKRSLLIHLQSLSVAQQKVLRLHYLQGVPFVEIAGLLAVSKGRVSQLHKEGLAALRGYLAGGKTGEG